MYIIFSKSIIFWSNESKRTLPWPETRNPYFIWLREVILQQTRVEQGAAYYLRFIESYPSIKDLAKAPLDEVYKKWEGLGYYSRARNLHQTAKIVSEQYDGTFPNSYQDVLSLKGIGEYTAAAIMSFAYDEPYAVLDGNVFRVLSRFFGVDIPIDTTTGKKYFKNLAQECLDKERPAQYNQAIIDLGAVICKPTSPLCDHCPLSSNCIAHQQGKEEVYPVKSKKLVRQHRFFNYLVVSDGEQIIIEQRTHKDIWQHLYQFPLIESEDRNLEIEELEGMKWETEHPIEVSSTYIQDLTHRRIHARFFEIRVKELKHDIDKQIVSIDKILDYGFPKIIREYLSARYNFIY